MKENGIEKGKTLIEVQQKEIDWEQRRFELVKAVTQGCLSRAVSLPIARPDRKVFSRIVLDISDTIIAELKKMNTKPLLINLLGTIADATDGMVVEDCDCGKLYIPTFRYELPFELTEEDVEVIKSLAEKDGEESAITLLDWIDNTKCNSK